jgi:hypothetical protein
MLKFKCHVFNASIESIKAKQADLFTEQKQFVVVHGSLYNDWYYFATQQDEFHKYQLYQFNQSRSHSVTKLHTLSR